MTVLDKYTSNPGNGPYVLAVIMMSILAAAVSVVIIFARPLLDPLDVLGRVSSLFAPTTLGLMAFMKSQETKLLVNGRVDAMIASATSAARLEGAAAERQMTIAAGVQMDAGVASVQRSIASGNADLRHTIESKK